jgi:hypothetical protein
MIKESDIVIGVFQGFYVLFNKRIDFPEEALDAFWNIKVHKTAIYR